MPNLLFILSLFSLTKSRYVSIGCSPYFFSSSLTSSTSLLARPGIKKESTLQEERGLEELIVVSFSVEFGDSEDIIFLVFVLVETVIEDDDSLQVSVEVRDISDVEAFFLQICVEELIPEDVSEFPAGVEGLNNHFSVLE